MVKYKKAWKCKNCPQRNDEEGCPMWWEILMVNDETGQKKVDKGCGMKLLPQMMANISKNSLHSVVASYDMRNKVVENTGKVVAAINEKMELGFTEDEILDMSTPDEILAIEDKEGEKEDEVS